MGEEKRIYKAGALRSISGCIIARLQRAGGMRHVVAHQIIHDSRFTIPHPVHTIKDRIYHVINDVFLIKNACFLLCIDTTVRCTNLSGAK